MSDLRDWLRTNKLEQFAETFEANDIDLDILSELTEADLEQLGVSIGNRRRLLKAIAEGGAAPTEKACRLRTPPTRRPTPSAARSRWCSANGRFHGAV